MTDLENLSQKRAARHEARRPLSRLERAAQFSRNRKAIIPVLEGRSRAGLSHDTAGSLVARYFDCMALPHAGDAALRRFRMKSPPQLAASFI
jgi:hypothetical protein